jgi:DNA-binding response OmpR family regulator
MDQAQQHVGYLGVVPQGAILVMSPATGGAREAVRSILKRRGHSVESAPTDFDAIAAIENIDVYDLLVLDLDIHDAEAVQLCAQLRQVTLAPLLVLVPETARNQGILALELGADSFVVVPFDRRELVARAEALVRRYRHAFLPLLAR